jgi:hypothetical protein
MRVVPSKFGKYGARAQMQAHDGALRCVFDPLTIERVSKIFRRGG